MSKPSIIKGKCLLMPKRAYAKRTEFDGNFFE